MAIRYLAGAAACCMLAIPGAFAQKAAPAAASPTVVVAPQPAAKPAQWPLVLPDKAAPKPPAVAPWSPQDIELAQARCAALLKGLHLVAVPEVPIREGRECGTAAPMKLISLGRSPQVALSPPPIVTCDMIAALHRWLERDVQPLARRHLGAPVIRIETMSSYSCRTAYGRAGGRISEHGKANALDIGSFVNARGQAAMVIANWGPTAREVAAQVAAAKTQAGNAAAEPAPPPSQQAGNAPGHRPVAADAALGTIRGSATTFSIPGITVLVPGMPQEGSSPMGLAPPSRLGGPKPARATTPADAPDDKMDFLRAVHGRACKLFNTVLGPEANKAHQNHFHVDMADRIKNTKVCE